MDRRMRSEDIPPWVPLVLLALLLACMIGIYAWSNSDCKDRGGHSEIVYGRRGGWVCDGAER